MEFVKRRLRSFIIGFINLFMSGTHFFKAKRRLLNLCSGIKIGDCTKIVGPICWGNCSNISIGKECWIGRDFSVLGDGDVVIADCCDFAPSVTILTGSHEIGLHERRAGKGVLFTIFVESGCWIGAKATLVDNIQIGEGAVIGACSLINKDVQRDTLVAGIPGKCIKELNA